MKGSRRKGRFSFSKWEELMSRLRRRRERESDKRLKGRRSKSGIKKRGAQGALKPSPTRGDSWRKRSNSKKK